MKHDKIRVVIETDVTEFNERIEILQSRGYLFIREIKILPLSHEVHFAAIMAKEAEERGD